MWTPYSNFSYDLIQAIDDGCRECHVVSVQFQNSFIIVNESDGSVSFELLLSIPISVDITMQVGMVNYSTATG